MVYKYTKMHKYAQTHKIHSKTGHRFGAHYECQDSQVLNSRAVSIRCQHTQIPTPAQTNMHTCTSKTHRRLYLNQVWHITQQLLSRNRFRCWELSNSAFISGCIPVRVWKLLVMLLQYRSISNGNRTSTLQWLFHLWTEFTRQKQAP